MSLSFTVTKRAAPAKPETPYRNPDLDYVEFARELLAEIAEQRERLASTEATIATLQARIEAGRRWLATHPEEHPRQAHNRELLARLEWDVITALWARRHSQGCLLDLRVGLYGAYDALTPLEQLLVDVNGIARPDHERYWQAMNNWQRRDI